MVIYIVYEKENADVEIGKADSIYIHGAYKSKRKANRKAKEILKKLENKKLYIDEDLEKTKNPFKRTCWVDLYKEKENQSEAVSSIILEETKLIA